MKKYFKIPAFILLTSVFLYSCSTTPDADENNSIENTIDLNEEKIDDETAFFITEDEETDYSQEDNFYSSENNQSDLNADEIADKNAEPEEEQIDSNGNTIENIDLKETDSLTDPTEEPAASEESVDLQENETSTNQDSDSTQEPESSLNTPEVQTTPVSPSVSPVIPSQPVSSQENDSLSKDEWRNENGEIEISEVLADEYTAEETDEDSISEKNIVPSRKVQLGNNQYLEVTYPGSGWIYLGEVEEYNLIRYFGRKLGETDTVFTLRTKGEGTTILHFYKNDPLTGSFIDDYLEVTIDSKFASQGKVTAPEYSEVVPPQAPVLERLQQTQNNTAPVQAPATSSEEPKASLQQPSVSESEKSSQVPAVTGQQTQRPLQQEENVPTVIQTTQDSTAQQKESTVARPSQTQSQNEAQLSTVQNLSADELLTLAKQCYDEKNFQQALDYITEFFNVAVNNIDEGLYLQGQILEANSVLRNIRAALESYETLTKMYPESDLWQKANERIIYLNRFYFNIR